MMTFIPTHGLLHHRRRLCPGEYLSLFMQAEFTEVNTMNQELKNEIISANRIHETDTGSPEVQIAILTE